MKNLGLIIFLIGAITAFFGKGGLFILGVLWMICGIIIIAEKIRR